MGAGARLRTGRHDVHAAARGGLLEVGAAAGARLRVRRLPVGWSPLTCAAAVEGGHLEVLKWAWEHGCPWDIFNNLGWDCCAPAAFGGHMEVLKWLRKHACPWNEQGWCTSGTFRRHAKANALTSNFEGVNLKVS